MSDELESGLPTAEPAAEASGGLDSIINSAIDRMEGADASADGAETGERARDERGRFAPKAEAEAPVVSDPQTETQAAQPAIEQPLEAPARWSEEDKAKFATWPRETQEAVLTRHKAMEADYTRKTQEIAEFRRHAEPLLEAVQPFNDYLSTVAQRLNRAPATLISDLLRTEYSLRTGTPEQKTQALAKIAAEYGISIAEAATGEGEKPNPFVNHLYQQFPQIDSRLSQIEQFFQQEQQERLNHQVEAFATAKDANGQPKHPYFEDVRPQMAALMQAGQASTLEQAYELAVGPLRKVMDAQQASRQQADERARQEALEKARRATGVRSSGTAPRGTTQAKGLDAVLSGALDRAGIG